MKRFIVPALIGILLGLLAGTGVAFARRPKAHAPVLPADSTAIAADSLHAGSLPADSLTADTLHLDSLHADSTATDTAHAQVTASHTTPQAAIAPVQKPAEAVRSDSAIVRLVGILAVMKPADAARLLQQLDDRSARRVLLALPERKAAALLAAVPQDRAASLTRAILTASHE